MKYLYIAENNTEHAWPLIVGAIMPKLKAQIDELADGWAENFVADTPEEGVRHARRDIIMGLIAMLGSELPGRYDVAILDHPPDVEARPIIRQNINSLRVGE